MLIGLSTFVNGSNKLFLDLKKWHTQQMTDEHCDLETKSAQWANSVKIRCFKGAPQAGGRGTIRSFQEVFIFTPLPLHGIVLGMEL